MQNVFVKIRLDLPDSLPGFWRKLKRFLGYYRIEAQDVYDADCNRITISFFTDKVEIKEGELRQVEIVAKRNKRGSWYFTHIEKH